MEKIEKLDYAYRILVDTYLPYAENYSFERNYEHEMLDDIRITSPTNVFHQAELVFKVVDALELNAFLRAIDDNKIQMIIFKLLLNQLNLLVMYELNVIEPRLVETTVVDDSKFFDWEKQKTQPLTLEQLERTHREVDVYGNPLKGIFHFQLFNQVVDMCKELGYNVEIYDMFAAQNRDKTQPGVVKLPQVEQQMGENAVEAHILRRVFANIRITDFDDAETTTNLAVAFHQRGIQVGFGPNVKFCHNQCMLSRELYASTYSEKGVPGSGMELGFLFEQVWHWLKNAKQFIDVDREKIERMKNTTVTASQIFSIIGMLTALRVKADTTRKNIRENITYPLNQSQITIFTEDMLEKYQEKKFVTAWDMYDSATNLYKADKMDIPQMLPQNRAMVSFIEEQFGI